MLEVDVKYFKQLQNLHNDLPFSLKERQLKSVTNLYVIYMSNSFVICMLHLYELWKKHWIMD